MLILKSCCFKTVLRNVCLQTLIVAKQFGFVTVVCYLNFDIFPPKIQARINVFIAKACEKAFLFSSNCQRNLTNLFHPGLINAHDKHFLWKKSPTYSNNVILSFSFKMLIVVRSNFYF